MDTDLRQRRCKSMLPYECKCCNRKFSRMNELQQHNKRHKTHRPKKSQIVTPDDEIREPIPKLVIRRNSSPLKSNGVTSIDIAEYEIVDLTVDDETPVQFDDLTVDETPVQFDYKIDVETTAITNTAVISLSSPSQKDSGIDDSSPLSCDEVRDSTDTVKVSTNEPIYSPYVGKLCTVTDNHNNMPSSSCEACGDNSRASSSGKVAMQDGTRNSNGVPEVLCTSLPSVTQVDATSTTNGFITIDLEHLNKIVADGSVTDSQGNISLTFGPNSEATRNIFDVIAKSGTTNSDEYVPVSKKARRSSSDFDTGCSQFNFYDSNQVDSVPINQSVTNNGYDSDTDGYNASFEEDEESVFKKQSQNSLLVEKSQENHNYLHSETVQIHDSASQQSYVSDTNSPATIEYIEPILADPSYEKDSNVVGCKETASLNTLTDMKASLNTQTDLQTQSKEILDYETYLDKQNCTQNGSTLCFSLKNDSPSKYQNEFTKFLSQSQENDQKSKSNRTRLKRKTIDSQEAIQSSLAVIEQSAYIANIFDNCGYLHTSSVKSVKVKLEDGEGLPSITTRVRVPGRDEMSLIKFEGEKLSMKSDAQHTTAIKGDISVKCDVKHQLTIKDEMTRHVKKESSEQLTNIDEVRESPGPKGPFQTSRSIRTHCKHREKLVCLRRQIVCLLHVLFPKLEYPSYFRSDSICVDVLLDEIMGLLQNEPTNKKVGALQSIPLENVCCDVRVLACPFTALTCLRNFRRKICKFLQHVLPKLQLDSSFQKTGEHVDELLYQVIECNSPT